MNRSIGSIAISAFCALLPPQIAYAADFLEPAFSPSTIQPKAITSNLTAIDRAGSRIVAVGERGHVLLSDNDGQNWKQVEIPTQRLLTGLSFSDEKNGWAVGHDHLILSTSNGGTDWVVQNVNINSDLPSPLLNIKFLDARRGIAVGAYGAAYLTNDGGNHWESIKENFDNEDEWHNYGLAVSDSGLLFVTGESGTFYRSQDGGLSWEKLPVPFDGTLFGVLPISDDQVITYGVAGVILYSGDRGQSWETIDSGTQASFYGAEIINDEFAMLVGSGGVTSMVNYTQKIASTGSNDDRITLSGLIALETGVGFVGMSGYKFSPLILQD